MDGFVQLNSDSFLGLSFTSKCPLVYTSQMIHICGDVSEAWQRVMDFQPVRRTKRPSDIFRSPMKHQPFGTGSDSWIVRPAKWGLDACSHRCGRLEA